MINKDFRVVSMHAKFTRNNGFHITDLRVSKIKMPITFKVNDVIVTNLGPSFHYIMKQL